jgi:hypothetical protein
MNLQFKTNRNGSNMAVFQSRPTPEHLAATVLVPGMPGVSYAVLVDNPALPGDETEEHARGRVWTEDGLQRLAIARLAAGLVVVFDIGVTPEALEPNVHFLAYDKRLFNG